MGDGEQEARDIDSLLWRIEALEERVQVLEAQLRIQAPKDELIGAPGIEAQFSKLFAEVGPEVHERAAKFFFQGISHDERVHILLSAAVITAYIANDPVYYTDTLRVMKEDPEKTAAVFSFIVRRMRTSEKANKMIFGKEE